MFLIAAVGILQGASAILALPGAGFALAAWDLMNLDRAMAGSTPTRSTVRFQKRHAWALALSVAVGLLLGEAGLALAFRVPFPVMCLLVLLDIVCLTQVFRLMRKDGSAR
jgi:hypothetical protein